MPTGANINQKYLTEGNTPRVTVSNINNGVNKICDCTIKTPDYRVYENFISVSFLGSVFYHKDKSSLDMKVHCLKPINNTLNTNTGLYLCSIIKKSIQNISYSDQISSTTLPKIKFLLPVTESKLPDWEYMNKYMEILKPKLDEHIKNLNDINSMLINTLNTNEWMEFKIYDIFEIDSGNKLDKSKMDTSLEIVNFVGRSNFNNGITQKVNIINGVTPFKSGNLTLALGGAYLGSCFIQCGDFYTSQNVVVLKPKLKISLEAKQFIATAIFKESQNNYQAFIKELNKHIKTDFKFMLPADELGEPDYTFMENYIKNINIKAHQVIENLNFIKRN